MSGTSATPRGGVAAALVVVYIAWGSTFVAMRVAVRSLPLLTMSGVRFLAAGVLLLAGACGGAAVTPKQAGGLRLAASGVPASSLASRCPPPGRAARPGRSRRSRPGPPRCCWLASPCG